MFFPHLYLVLLDLSSVFEIAIFHDLYFLGMIINSEMLFVSSN